MKRQWGAATIVLVLACLVDVMADNGRIPPAVDVERAPWPCWRGPYSSGEGPSRGEALVDDLDLAVKLWQSERGEIPCNMWDNGTFGGYDSPIVADGKVIISFFEGAGDVIKPQFQKEYAGVEGLDWKTRKNITVESHDIVLCVDAETGKTLWERVLGTGLNLAYFLGKSGPHCTPCWHNDRVYAQSTLGRVYCLDDETGATIWEAPVSTTAHMETLLQRRIEAARAAREAAKNMKELAPGEVAPEIDCELEEEPETTPDDSIMQYMSPMSVADGVLVAHNGGPHWSHKTAMTAFDATTGEKLWEGAVGGSSAALRWVAPSGKEYFILNNQCVEPRTGNVLWEAEDTSVGAATPALTPDRIVFNGGGMKPDVTCYAIDEKGARLVAHFGRDHKIGAGTGSNLILGDYLYIHSGPLRAVELASGQVLNVSAVPGMYWDEGASIVAMDGRIFGWASPPAQLRVEGETRRNVYMVNADPDDFRLMGSMGAMNQGRSLTPAVAFGRLYIRQSEGLACYDIRERVAMRAQLTQRLPSAGKDKIEATLGDAGALASVFQEALDHQDSIGMSACYFFLRELGDDAVGQIIPRTTTAMVSTNYQVSAAACGILFPDGKARTPEAEALLPDLVLQGHGAAIVTFDRLDHEAKQRATARFEEALRSDDPALMRQAATFLAKVDSAAFTPVIVRHALSLINERMDGLSWPAVTLLETFAPPLADGELRDDMLAKLQSLLLCEGGDDLRTGVGTTLIALDPGRSCHVLKTALDLLDSGSDRDVISGLALLKISGTRCMDEALRTGMYERLRRIFNHKNEAVVLASIGAIERFGDVALPIIPDLETLYAERDSPQIRATIRGIAWLLPGRPKFEVKIDMDNLPGTKASDGSLDSLLDDL